MLITQKYLQVKPLISQISNHVTMVFNTVMKMFGGGGGGGGEGVVIQDIWIMDYLRVV